MSAGIEAKSARARATIAANMIKKQDTFGRSFDDCFEMGDGDQVMDWIIEKARTDLELAVRLKDLFPELGAGDSNKRMHDAIDECLGLKEPYNLFSCMD